MIIVDDNYGRWNDMCEWLNENVPDADTIHRYYLGTEEIELNFSNSEDELAFKLKFRI
jgi:hypothetical protein